MTVTETLIKNENRYIFLEFKISLTSQQLVKLVCQTMMGIGHISLALLCLLGICYTPVHAAEYERKFYDKKHTANKFMSCWPTNKILARKTVEECG
jgi:hypothetical protein